VKKEVNVYNSAKNMKGVLLCMSQNLDTTTPRERIWCREQEGRLAISLGSMRQDIESGKKNSNS
jgi:hypothetical protein